MKKISFRSYPWLGIIQRCNSHETVYIVVDSHIVSAAALPGRKDKMVYRAVACEAYFDWPVCVVRKRRCAESFRYDRCGGF